MRRLLVIVALVGVLSSCGILRERAAQEQAAKDETARLLDHHQKAVAKLSADKQTYAALQKKSEDLLAEMDKHAGLPDWSSLSDQQSQVQIQMIALASTVLSDVMDSWVGSKSDELLAQWGSPDSTFKDSQGNSVWTYQSLAGFGLYTHQTKREFWINKDNVIYNWRWEGL